MNEKNFAYQISYQKVNFYFLNQISFQNSPKVIWVTDPRGDQVDLSQPMHVPEQCLEHPLMSMIKEIE